jgi:hypothetical protein
MAEDVEALVKKEVAAARAILREDKLLASHTALKTKLDKHFPDEAETPDDGKPKPPDKKDTPETGEPERKPGIWWGEANSGE